MSTEVISRQHGPAIVFLVIFSLLLLWPLLAWIGPDSWKVDAFENRHPAAFPTKLSKDWPKRFERYLDDHLPNRGLLLRMNAWVKYHIFNTSPVDSVLVGKDGWLFHRMPDDLIEFEGRLRREPHQIRRLRVVLEERRDWLAERGVDYLVLIAPTKQTIYPEKMPDWLTPGRAEKSRRELLKAELHRVGSDLKLFDFAPVLIEAKKNSPELLYYLHDSHWNYRGAVKAYAALARRYPEWFHEPRNDWVDAQKTRDSNLMHLMGLPGQEFSPYPQPAGGFAARPLALDTEGLKEMAKRGPVEVHHRPDAKAAPRLYLMVDSFGGWNAKYIAENFSRTVLTNTWGDQWQRHEQFPLMNIEAERPHLVIDQMLENRLDVGIHRNLLADGAGDNHPGEVRTARLRRLLHSVGESVAKFERSADGIEIQTPEAKGGEAYIVHLELQADDSASIEAVSPFPDALTGKDPCRKGGELSRRTTESGRTDVLLCAVAAPDTATIRLRLNAKKQAQVLRAAVAPHPDVF